MLHLGVPWQNGETNSAYYRDTLRLLAPPRWYNWKFDLIGQQGYHPMLWKCERDEQFDRALARAKVFPGQTWLLGNEPEPELSQSKTTPMAFRDAVRAWLPQVNGRWAGPGILWWDPGRRWLDEYLRIGGPVPDYWAIHIYGSSSVEVWLSQYDHALRWFSERGVVRPIWVTETNIAGDATAQKPLLDFLQRSSHQVWWYCAFDPFRSNTAADLTNKAGNQTTPLGYRYGSYNLSQLPGGSNSVYLPVVHS